MLDALADKLEDAGLDTETAKAASTEIPLDEERFLNLSAQMVFGVNTDELGSPVTAAISSLTLFAVGALVPLLPWFFTSGTSGVLWSSVLTAVASLGVGAFVSSLSSTPLWRGALRQFVIVVLASAVTYGVGALFGTAIS
jgi:vacuolar iron transporter family protein